MDGESSLSRPPSWSISRAGLAGGLLGFVLFLLPRLYIGIAYLRGVGQETDESLSDFWEFAGVSFAYLPAIVASLAVPQGARWPVLLIVAGVTQWLTFPLHDAQPWMGMVQLWASPATVLLVLGAWTSFMSWRHEVNTVSSETKR